MLAKDLTSPRPLMNCSVHPMIGQAECWLIRLDCHIYEFFSDSSLFLRSRKNDSVVFVLVSSRDSGTAHGTLCQGHRDCARHFAYLHVHGLAHRYVFSQVSVTIFSSQTKPKPVLRIGIYRSVPYTTFCPVQRMIYECCNFLF